MRLKFGHMGDAHIYDKYLKDNLKSLEFIKDRTINDPELDALIVPGDVWDGPIHIITGTPLYDAIRIFDEIANVKPVLMIYGNHDESDSLKIFHEKNKNIYIASKILELVYLHNKRFYPLDDFKLNGHPPPDNIFFCLRFPQSADWVDNMVKKPITTDMAIRAEFLKQKEYITSLGLEKAKRIIVAHGSLEGYMNQNDKVGEYDFSVETFNTLEPDYIALGHIHKFQTLMNGRACYPSSIISTNFGELDKKYFCKITLTDDEFKFEKMEIPIRYRVKKKLEWTKNTDNEKFLQDVDDALKLAESKIEEYLTELIVKAPSVILTKINFVSTSEIKLTRQFIHEDPKEIKYIPNERNDELFERWYELKNEVKPSSELVKKHNSLLKELDNEEEF